MKKILYIIMLLCCVCSGVEAKKAKSAQKVEHSEAFLHYYYAASQAFALRNYADAMSLFMLCHEIEPNDAAACWYIGYILRAMDLSEEAMPYLRQAYEAVPTQYWDPYASELYRQGNLKSKLEAAKVLEKAMRLAPDDMEISEALLNMYMNEGKHTQALSLLDKMDRYAGSASTYTTYLRFHAYLEQNKPEKGLRCIQDYLNDEPMDFYIQILEGDAYLSMHNTQKAEDTYRRIEQHYPTNPYIYKALGGLYSRLSMLTTADDGTRTQAQDSLFALMHRMVSNDEQKYETKIRTISDLRAALKKGDRGERYEKLLNQLATVHPEEEQTYVLMAEYYSERGEHKKAREALLERTRIQPGDSTLWEAIRVSMTKDTAITLEEQMALSKAAHEQMPRNIQWHYFLGLAYMISGQTDSAIQVLHEGVETGGMLLYEGSICGLLGDIYSEQMHQTDSAIVYYEKAIGMGMQNMYLYNNYAYLLATHGGDLSKAEQMSSKTIKAEPENPTFLDTYAWILHLQGQGFLSQYYMKKAWDNTPEPMRTGEVLEHYNAIFNTSNK